MELYIGKILKFQGEIQVLPGENIGFPGETWRNFPLFLPVSPRKKGSCSWRKIKSGDFYSPALYITNGCKIPAKERNPVRTGIKILNHMF